MPFLNISFGGYFSFCGLDKLMHLKMQMQKGFNMNYFGLSFSWGLNTSTCQLLWHSKIQSQITYPVIAKELAKKTGRVVDPLKPTTRYKKFKIQAQRGIGNEKEDI